MRRSKDHPVSFSCEHSPTTACSLSLAIYVLDLACPTHAATHTSFSDCAENSGPPCGSLHMVASRGILGTWEESLKCASY